MSNKTILGLDLGVSSIGWAIIERNDENGRIVKSGVRVIPSSKSELSVFKDFDKGKPASFSKERTEKRGIRRSYFRKKLRRAKLIEHLKENNMFDPELLGPKYSIDVWEWREKATKEKITLAQLGRVLLHINQKRGYKSNRKAIVDEESDSNWLNAINDNSKLLREKGITVGEYFYQEGKLHERKPKVKFALHFRMKVRIFNRKDYLDEIEQIWKKQSEFYPELTDELKESIIDHTIFYQRPLKSAKHLLSECRYEKMHKVIARSNPLFQLFRVLEKVNNLRAEDAFGNNREITDEEKLKIIEACTSAQSWKLLDKKKNLSKSKIKSILGLGKDYEINLDSIEGSKTLHSIWEVLMKSWGEAGDWIDFDWSIQGNDFSKQKSYQLWHALYSIDEPQYLRKKLCEGFGFDLDTARLLMNIRLESDYGALSARAIKRIIPELLKFPKDATKAIENAGYKFTDSETKEERESRELKDRIEHLKKGALRNPVVEKVLNQLVTLVNAIYAHPELPNPDEIRVELARELKSGAKERRRAELGMARAAKDNDRIRELLQTEFGIPYPGRRDILRYRFWEEQDMRCVYSGDVIPRNKLFVGEEYELDHIIPRARLFNDSNSNLVLVKSSENKDKSDMTAADYMKSKGEKAFEEYLVRVKNLYDKGAKKKAGERGSGINKGKRNFLIMKKEEIPQDFIERQLRESQYIVKEAVKLLKEVCRDVTTTTGKITDLLKHQWGANDVFRNIQVPKYRKWGMTETIVDRKTGEVIERIIDWSKRKDHRHHALDAIIVACTRQSYIQQLNRLNVLYENDYESLKSYRKFELPWPSFHNDLISSLESLLVSFRNKRRVATMNKNRIKVGGKKKYIVQKTLTPRDAFHLETTYGRRLVNNYKLVKLNKKFSMELAELVIDPDLKEKILNRLMEFGNDPQKAFANLKKNPFKWKNENLEEVLIYDEVFTTRKKLDEKFNNPSEIIDPEVREIVTQRLKEFDNNPKKAFADIENKPVWYNKDKQIRIKTVNTRAKASDLYPVRTKENGNPKDFVFTRNNHHITVYQKEDGKYYDKVTSFWEAFELKKAKMPIYKENDDAAKAVLHLKINDMVLVDLNPEDLDQNDPEFFNTLSEHLYRVQKLASGDVTFRHHLETELSNKNTEVRVTNAESLYNRVVMYPLDVLGLPK